MELLLILTTNIELGYFVNTESYFFPFNIIQFVLFQSLRMVIDKPNLQTFKKIVFLILAYNITVANECFVTQ